MPKKTIKPMTVSETLRSVLIDSKLPLKRIQIETGVPRNSLRRFIQGEQSLRSDLICWWVELPPYLAGYLTDRHLP